MYTSGDVPEKGPVIQVIPDATAGGANIFKLYIIRKDEQGVEVFFSLWMGMYMPVRVDHGSICG